MLRAVIQPASQRWPVTERIMRAILRNIIILMVSGYHESDEITFLRSRTRRNLAGDEATTSEVQAFRGLQNKKGHKKMWVA